MTVKSTILGLIQAIADEGGKKTPVLTDDVLLLDSGLDSLGLAILVARLEETLGFDPFSESDDPSYPITLGDFIQLYEGIAKTRGVDLGHAR